MPGELGQWGEVETLLANAPKQVRNFQFVIPSLLGTLFTLKRPRRKLPSLLDSAFHSEEGEENFLAFWVPPFSLN